MRLDDEKILWLALVTLADYVEAVHDAPARPSPQLRLALAVAFKFSKTGEREPFDAFWRQATGIRPCYSEEMAQYERTTHLMTQLRGVLRAVGTEPTFEVEHALRNAATKGGAIRRSRQVS